MRGILFFLLVVTSVSAADSRVRTKIPGGTVILQPGYAPVASSKQRAAFLRPNGEPAFESEIGASVAPRLTDQTIDRCRWWRKTWIHGRKVLMGISKDDDVITVTVIGNPAQEGFKAANFYGEFEKVEEVGDVILIALSFEPAT